ncbi:CS-domain-containing protein [Jaminaea rosea]|uniref:Nuclear movement protein nudC n=1 Tax=Jaminaea rosea TaxID=1569628 RepID=A0A316UR69_9BASI|nr:CS-domain-containing protein [Jaminaea rosea]PWN26811.1 CS-domain-containing protein [Jaminaea rosea]
MDASKYDSLSPAEKEAHDAAERRREAEEQAALPYRWTQALDHVEVTLPLPAGTRAKQLDVAIKRASLRVGLKDGEKTVLMAGDLPNPVQLDDCTWSVDSAASSSTLTIHLEKAKQTWWPHVLTSDPKIDTTKIVPENSKLSDLDGETRAMVEKMMFDNRQKEMGLPTSDQQKQSEIFEKFKREHPEMDFSQTKVGGSFGGDFGQ